MVRGKLHAQPHRSGPCRAGPGVQGPQASYSSCVCLCVCDVYSYGSGSWAVLAVCCGCGLCHGSRGDTATARLPPGLPSILGSHRLTADVQLGATCCCASAAVVQLDWECLGRPHLHESSSLRACAALPGSTAQQTSTCPADTIPPQRSADLSRTRLCSPGSSTPPHPVVTRGPHPVPKCNVELTPSCPGHRGVWCQATNASCASQHDQAAGRRCGLFVG